MKKASFIFSIFVLIITLSGCQKEEYKNVHMLLTADQPVNTGGTDYVLSGKIISSGKVDLSDYGFDVMVGSNTIRYSIGATQKQGKVQTIITVPGGVTVSDAALYAYDHYGTFYSSNVQAQSTTFNNPLLFAAPSHTSDTNYEYFYGSISNGDASHYVVVEYGLQYRLTSSTTWDSRHTFNTNYDPNPSISIYATIPTTPTTFNMAADYAYRYYVKIQRLSDGAIQEFYSGENTFTAVAL